MKYCKRCMSMDTRYGMELDENGICGGCHYQDSLETIDWNQRKKELDGIIEEAKRKARQNDSLYDCCIGVSGGKDSTLLAGYLKENYDINALLINGGCQPVTENGKHNVENLRKMGYDLLQFWGDPEVGRKLALYSFEKFGHICKPVEHMIFSMVTRTALNFNIPLIVMAENSDLVWGTNFGTRSDNWFANVTKTKTNKDIYNAKLWEIDGIDPRKLNCYRFPSYEEIEAKGLRAICLQYYIKEFSPVYNADYSVARGMRGRYDDTPEEIGRYRIFSSVDDDLMIVNEMLKYLKNGFGRAHDDVVFDIREGRMSWEEGIKMVEKFDGLCGQKYIDYCCNYLGITEEYFWQVVDKWANKKLFKKDENGKWVRKFKVGTDFDEEAQTERILVGSAL